MLDNAKDQCTVKDLKELLNELSNNGYDNMPIFLGNKTPLLNDVGIHSTTDWQWWGITLCTIVFALVKNKR